MYAYKKKEAAYNEAQGKPRMAFDDLAAVVSAVVALADDALVALNLFAEGVFAAGKYNTHGWGEAGIAGYRYKVEAIVV